MGSKSKCGPSMSDGKPSGSASDARLSDRHFAKLERDASNLIAALNRAGSQGPEYAFRLGLLSEAQVRQMRSRRMRQMTFPFFMDTKGERVDRGRAPVCRDQAARVHSDWGDKPGIRNR
jgi:hypothetical protein